MLPPYAWPQLFFSCWFRPIDGRLPSQCNYMRGPDDFEMHLVFFSTFEELLLPVNQDVQAVPYSNTVRGSLEEYAGQGSPVSLVA